MGQELGHLAKMTIFVCILLLIEQHYIDSYIISTIFVLNMTYFLWLIDSWRWTTVGARTAEKWGQKVGYLTKMNTCCPNFALFEQHYIDYFLLF